MEDEMENDVIDAGDGQQKRPETDYGRGGGEIGTWSK